jgi:hypothetical protein
MGSTPDMAKGCGGSLRRYGDGAAEEAGDAMVVLHGGDAPLNFRSYSSRGLRGMR